MMKTRNFREQDDLLDFIDMFVFYGGCQFQAAYHHKSREWVVFYPPGVMPDDQDDEDEEEAG